MNNSRYDSHERKKLFNFQFTKYQEPTRKVHSAKYDYMKLPDSWQDADTAMEERDIVSYPEDDISLDSEDFASKPIIRESLNAVDLQELEDLDDILGDVDTNIHLQHTHVLDEKEIDYLLDEIDPNVISAPIKKTANSVDQDINITQEDLDDLMEVFLEMN